jgi:hypothetical protein
MNILSPFQRSRKQGRRGGRRRATIGTTSVLQRTAPDYTNSAPLRGAFRDGLTVTMPTAPTGPSMRQRPRTVATAPYQPDEVTRMLRHALADAEQTAVIPAVPAQGPSAVRLPAHSTVTVPLWRPPVADNAPSLTSWDDPPVEFAAVQDRVSVMRALSSCVDEPWFREDAALARDRSLRAFHARWSTPDARAVFLNRPSPRTLAMATVGTSEFVAPGRRTF